MGLDKKDFEMMAVSIPTVDWFDVREEIEKLSDTVNRLEAILTAFVELYRQERVKTWEMVLNKILEREDKKRGRRGTE